MHWTTTSSSCDPAANGFQLTNVYALGPSNEQMSEYAADADGDWEWQHTNVWAAGKILATYQVASQPNPSNPSNPLQTSTLHFYLDGPLGSRRVQTDYAGVVEQTCTSLPYGDGESCAPSPTGHLFTGKERDTESGNDYFGARYYASSMGRFMSPDPMGIASGSLTNPQSLNLYSYVLNNPLIGIDPDGRECVWDDGSYDSKDDPDSGSADKCSGLGGTWIGDDVFENSQYYRGDWSGDADSTLGGLVGNIQSCSAAVGGGQAQSLLIADAFTLGYTDDETAYLLASAQWESGMGTGMTERGSAAYLAQYDGNSSIGNTQAGDGALFRGRGYIQITGRGTYAGWSKVLGVNLTGNPTLATNPDIAAQIASEGAFRGTFTGKSLYDYINGSGTDFVNARRVVNGDVKKNGAAIAGIANGFSDSIPGCR